MTRKTNVLAATLAFAVVSAATAGAYAADVNLYPGANWVSAINHAQPGDRILMHAGTYAGGGWIGPVHGAASAPITVLSADGPRAAVIQGGGESLRVGDGSSYLVFDGLEVRNSGSNTVHIDGQSSYITLRNLYVHDAGLDGDVVKINQSNHITVERSEMARPGPYANPQGNPYQQCLDFVDVDDSAIRDNYIHDAGSQLAFVKGDSTNDVIERNLFTGQHADASDPAVGIGGPTDLSILGGKAYEAQQIVFRNNVIYGCPVGAIAVYDTSGAFIANNLLLDNGGVELQFRAGNGAAGGSTQVRAVNNLFVDTRGQMPTPYVLWSHKLSDFTTSNNLFWNNGAAIPTSALLDVAAQPGHLVANPLVGTSSGTTRDAILAALKPGAGSPAAGSAMDASGSPYFVTDDILANPRNGALDRGPFVLSTGVASVSYTTSATTGVVGQPTTITATSAGSGAPRYHYWVVTPAGAWTQPCGGYTASATCAFTPTAAGTWQIAVSARDANSTANFDATTNEQNYAVAATPPPPSNVVASVSYTTSATTGVVGQPTTITATSAGSSAPRYHYWVVTPAGSWTQPCGGYTADATCTFTPTTAGTWQIAVSARDANSTANFDATTNEQNYTVNAAK